MAVWPRRNICRETISLSSLRKAERLRQKRRFEYQVCRRRLWSRRRFLFFDAKKTAERKSRSVTIAARFVPATVVFLTFPGQAGNDKSPRFSLVEPPTGR